MNTDLSVVHLIVGASPLVQAVMFLLLLASIYSWTIIFAKWKALRAANMAADDFERLYRASNDLGDLYTKSSKTTGKPGQSGLETIFKAGYRDFLRLRKEAAEVGPSAIIEGAQRSMRGAINRETDALELHLPFLATVGSTAPYVGLFGTVWGIMNSFRALGDAKQATLAMVAPGISEALVATAMGLFAAIPAVIAYNRNVTEVDRLLGRYETFYEEFSTALLRGVCK